MQDEGGVHLLAHDIVPGAQVFQVSGEAIDEEPSALHAVLLHGALQQHDGDLAGDYFPLHDVLLDYLAVLGAWLLALCAKQVPSGEVHKFEVFLDVLALRALARPWPAEDEDHRRFLLHQHESIYKNLKICVIIG